METIKIRADQENRAPELRQKQASNAMAAQQKRPILGEIDSNKVSFNKGKQPPKKINDAKIRVNNENQKNVVVPVAQFEAFKVYEDDDQARIDQKLRMISKNKNNVYKGTADDKFITKTELAEMERKKHEIIEVPEVKSEREVEVPMSIEKANEENSVKLAEQVILKNHQSRDVFFEMEEYRDDIYQYLREREKKHRPKPGYIRKQPDVTENMRAVLVDWLVEVVEEYKMQTETLYLAVNFIDRFLSYMSVVRAKLQLVGTAAMFIASKYEEIIPPDVSEFVYITDDTYDKSQVIRMEHLILRVLGFDLSIPTPLTFISAICISTKQTEKVLYLAMYLSEIALLEVEPFLEFLPSTVASSAIALSRYTLGLKTWDDSLERITGYPLRNLRHGIEFLYSMFVKAPTLPQRAIQDKYKSEKYLQVSKIAPRKEVVPFN